MRKGKQGFTLIELMIVIAIIAIIAAIAIPGLLSSQRASNERNASTSLKTLASAEADFRSNDRDWNHVNDFWTANVSGLYTMTSLAVPGATANSTTDPSVKLIELSVASADGDGVFVSAGGENLNLTVFAVPSAKAGYWYQALTADGTMGGTLEATYALDTGGTLVMGSVHNTSKFGFCSYPDSTSAGKYVFIVNENNTIFRSATTGSCRGSTSNPPGPLSAGAGAVYAFWPDDATLKSFWSKLD
jgi:prepilin-type N-terminal cleavage/methylation domain-containing protein